MGDEKIPFIEKFKALSLFLSSVVISCVGIYLTHQIAESQTEIARINNITKMIQIISSENKAERRMAAISLGLYGKSAVPALIALLGDPDGDVRLAATEALSVIGDPAYQVLRERFENKLNDTNVRAGSLYALGKMRNPRVKQLALRALNDEKEDATVKKDAINALGFIKDISATKQLSEILTQSKHEAILKSTIWSLGEINTRESKNILTSYLSHAPEDLKKYTQDTISFMDIN